MVFRRMYGSPASFKSFKYSLKTIPVHQKNTTISRDLQPNLSIHCDNQSAIKLAKNPVFRARSKHIKIHHLFIRERVLEGEIDLKFISTAFQPAEILTKPLRRIKFEQHQKNLNLHNLSFLKSNP